ncbi:MAG: ABC transporter substrate-binding protein [Leptolyngbyaceae cyanobacterium bins.59]|nr:ABC transporter substrate-binding protein [Leptolyngbyaceae cyanobacterium bins.59]
MITKKSPSSRAGLPPIAYIVLAIILIGGGYKLYSSLPTFLTKFGGSEVLSHSTPKNLQNRLSLGDRLLITDQSSPEKQKGIEAVARGDYKTAVIQFESSLRIQRNDPETLIYLNNARIGKNPSWTIAVSVPIGSNLNVAQEILRGVAQAQDEVNRTGGIQGIPIQVMIANDDNDSDLVKQIATQFVQNSKILAVVGHNTSSASLTAAPIYQQGGLVMISPTSFADNLSGAGSYIFRTVSNTQVMADTLARYTVKSARKGRVAICFDSQAPDNVSFKDSFIGALLSNGGQLVPISCDFSSPTFNPDGVVSQAINHRADALLLAPHVDRIDQAIQIARSNKQRLTLLGSPTLYTIKTLQSGQTEVNGLTLPVSWHPENTSGQVFAKQAIQLWGGTVNWRTATAYDATQAIFTALKQNQDREGVQQILRNPGFLAHGAGEPIQFLPTGDRLAPPKLIQVKPGSSGGVKFTPLHSYQSGQE